MTAWAQDRAIAPPKSTLVKALCCRSTYRPHRSPDLTLTVIKRPPLKRNTRLPSSHFHPSSAITARRWKPQNPPRRVSPSSQLKSCSSTLVLSTETLRKSLEDGFPSKHMTTTRWTLNFPANGARVQEKRVLELKVYGVTKTSSAIGVELELHVSVLKPNAMMVSGKTPRKSVVSTEFLSSSMRRTLQSLQRDSRQRSTSVSWLMLSSSTATTLRTCPSIRFPKSTQIK